MKKTFVAFLLLVMVSAFFTSCASSRSRGGCPSHNPRYFRA